MSNNDQPMFDWEPPNAEATDQLRRDYEAGNFFALHEAYLRFGGHGLPLPPWVFIEVSRALEQAWVRGGGSKGRGKTGGYKVRTMRVLTPMVRHSCVEKHLAARGTEGGPKDRDEAFKRASEELVGTRHHLCRESLKHWWENKGRSRQGG